MPTRTVFVLVCALLISSCNPEPQFVFVTETQSSASLNIGASSVSVSQGEEILLSASRENHGSWLEVPRKSLSADDCWMVEPPSPYEEQVAGNVKWILTPAENGTFNLGLRKDGKRSLVISEPGAYELIAISSVWCGEPVESENRIALEITD